MISVSIVELKTQGGAHWHLTPFKRYLYRPRPKWGRYKQGKILALRGRNTVSW